MQIPTPSDAVAAVASFVRERLAEVGGSLAPLLGRDASPGRAHRHAELETLARARQVAMVIIGAAAPFAPTSHARARLLRQAHASGLLSAAETEQAISADALVATDRG